MPEDQKTDTPESPQSPLPIVSAPERGKKRWLMVVGAVLILVIAGVVLWWLMRDTEQEDSALTTNSADDDQDSSTVEGIKLDPAKNYGVKYADGLLPVGDSKYVTDGAKKGYIYMCNANFVPADQAGAQTRGPWFVNNNTQWDINKKVEVQGNVNWDQNITVEIKSGKRVVTTNDLPDHHTGVFPVSNSDPAYNYDRNPNSIKGQSFVYSLTEKPAYGSPQCMGGEVGIMLTGTAIFNGFDAGGRDAGAWEVQDSCDGHPQSAGAYHYHTLSRCIKDISVQTIIGYALDGFPITGPKVDEGSILTTDDLDECHGIVSDITVDGKKLTTYHYVMTQDFPYSASCFRATAINPPGQQEGQTGSNQQGQSSQGGQQPPPPGSQPPPQ